MTYFRIKTGCDIVGADREHEIVKLDATDPQTMAEARSYAHQQALEDFSPKGWLEEVSEDDAKSEGFDDWTQ